MPPSPKVKVRLPFQSKRCPLGSVTGSLSWSIPHIVPIIPIGTFMRNTNRHEIDVSTPPTTGPRRNPAENAIPFTPKPKPTLPLRKASVTITALLVRRSAPPTPCTMR